MNPTDADAVLLKGAKGNNDAFGLQKMPDGMLPFSMNQVPTGTAWERRRGRDFYLLQSGFVTSIYTTNWDDGTAMNIASMGATYFNLSNTFTYLVADGIRLVIQSADLNYWDVTPADATGLINPVVVAAPAAAAQVANFTVLNGESFGFILSSGNVTRLTADQDHNGFYLMGYGTTTSLSSIATDLVFTVTSGFSFRIQDYSGNVWKMVISNDGQIQAVTV